MSKTYATRDTLTKRRDYDEVEVAGMTLRIRPLMAGDLVEWSDRHRDNPATYDADTDLLALVLVDEAGDPLFEDGADVRASMEGLTFLEVWNVVSDIVFTRNFPDREKKD